MGVKNYELDERLIKAHYHLRETLDIYTVYFKYVIHTRRESKIDAKSEVIILKCLHESLVIKTCIFLDWRNGKHSIVKILNCRKETASNAKLREYFLDSIKPYQEIINTLAIWRDKRYAHLDISESEFHGGITLNDIQSILLICMNVINGVAYDAKIELPIYN